MHGVRPLLDRLADTGLFEPASTKECLRSFKFPRRWFFQEGRIAVAVIIAAFFLGASISSSESSSIGQAALSGIATAGAALLAFWQWREGRHETTLDRFYDRLDRANQRFIAMLATIVEPLSDHTSQKKREDATNMYIFAELDNLEYAIEKYKLGFMKADLALRALNTFRSRFTIDAEIPDEFLKKAESFSKAAGYSQPTREVVSAVVAWASGKPRSLDWPP